MKLDTNFYKWLIYHAIYSDHYWTKGCYWLSWSHHFESWKLKVLRFYLVKYMRHKWVRYVPFVVSTYLSFPHSWLIIGFVTRVTGRVPLVEQELPTLPERLRSSPVFNGVRVALSLFLFVVFCRWFFHLAIVLSVLFRLTDSDYPFVTFKLCLWQNFDIPVVSYRFAIKGVGMKRAEIGLK